MAQCGVTHTRLGARGAGVSTPSLSSKRAGGDPAPRARGGQAAPRGAITITATEGNQSKVKGHKRSEKRRQHHKAKRSELRTRMKRLYQQCERAEQSGDLSQIGEYMDAAYKAIDKGAKQGAIADNAASRAKRSLQKRKKAAEVRLGVLDPSLSSIVPHTVAKQAGSAKGASSAA